MVIWSAVAKEVPAVGTARPISAINCGIIAPNPFKSEVLVENVRTEAKEIKVMDISGRVVYSQKIMNLEGTIQLSLPANLENGIYFMMFEGSTNELIKLIKN